MMEDGQKFLENIKKDHKIFQICLGKVSRLPQNDVWCSGKDGR
jgi:hypothetical protein